MAKNEANGTPQAFTPIGQAAVFVANILGKDPDAKKIKAVTDLVYNVYTSRMDFWRQLMDPRRDVYAECGFPKTNEVTVEHLKDLYDREPVAARVVELFPKETWQTSPEVYESEDVEQTTPFELAWEEVGKQIRGEKSWYQSNEGHPIWEMLERVDILSGIGRYGVILLGLNDKDDQGNPVPLNLPVQLPEEGSPPLKLLYMRVLPEALARVGSLENDKNSPRFGQPTTYQVTLNDPNEMTAAAVIGASSFTQDVHWSRVIHVVDEVESNEWLGIPRMRCVLNQLLNLRKISGGSGEMYWKGAFPGLSIESNPQLGSDIDVDRDAMRTMIQNYQNGLDRYLALMGFQAKTLSPTFIDPTGIINVQLDLICIKLGCPIPVFKGYEIGEQASTENRKQWDDRVMKRQVRKTTPKLIVPLVDRFIQYGLLPIPESGYQVYWPPLSETSGQEKASVGATITSALAQYAAGGVESLIPPAPYMINVLGMDEEEVNAMLNQAAEVVEGTSDASGGSSPLLSMVGGITGMTELFGKFKEGIISEPTLKQMLMLFYKIDEGKADELIASGVLDTSAPVPGAEDEEAETTETAPTETNSEIAAEAVKSLYQGMSWKGDN